LILVIYEILKLRYKLGKYNLISLIHSCKQEAFMLCLSFKVKHESIIEWHMMSVSTKHDKVVAIYNACMTIPCCWSLASCLTIVTF
jgi:hypothetical protein